ncbi:MAG: queuosine precursor transporter [Planctomycetota bacterium]|nr:queuosine precursor transporter [Planctomycetota bacterium]
MGQRDLPPEVNLSPEYEPFAENPLEGRSEVVFLMLAALFTGSLVVTNLIANKFIHVNWLGHEFILSAGVLPYPITFLITDLLSEIYGRRRANLVVFGGFLASILVLITLYLGDQFPAIADSTVDDGIYTLVFGNTWRVIGASMTAYLVAQFVDIRIFHFWKRLTKGKHLWLRNNASTLLSQLLDSALVVFVLFAGKWPPAQMGWVILDLWLFKASVALLDTPLFYLGAAYLPRWMRGGKAKA